MKVKHLIEMLDQLDRESVLYVQYKGYQMPAIFCPLDFRCIVESIGYIEKGAKSDMVYAESFTPSDKYTEVNVLEIKQGDR
jgi:hypothetical protein